MVVANHGPVLSNLYTSAKITPYEVQFSLSLERVMFYNPNVTWHDSWLAATAGMCIRCLMVSTNQADPDCFYFRIS